MLTTTLITKSFCSAVYTVLLLIFRIVLYISEQTWRLAFKDVILSWFSIIQQKSVQLIIRAVSTDKVQIALMLIVCCSCALLLLLTTYCCITTNYG